jgi:ATP-dependent helicase HrpB
LTPIGEQVRAVPLHPRLARMLVAAGGATDIVRVCALLSERHLLPPRTATTSSDLLSALDQWADLPAHVRQAADSVLRIADRGLRIDRGLTEEGFRRAILAGYPDRVAMRREAGSDSFLLASGSGARLARESGVRDAPFIVALDVQARQPRSPSDEKGDPLIRIASRVEREWLQPTAVETVHRFDEASGRVRASRVERYDALTLGDHPVAIDPLVAADLLAEAWLARGPRGDDERLVRRLAFAGLAVDLPAVVRAAAYDARSIDDIDLARALPATVARDLPREAPEMFVTPGGRSKRLEYEPDGVVSLSVKLQDLFGVLETPRIGRRRVPVRVALLAPNGRPVQVTQDLRSFWERTYPEVRKELRGRYPKHAWPENPLDFNASR